MPTSRPSRGHPLLHFALQRRGIPNPLKMRILRVSFATKYLCPASGVRTVFQSDADHEPVPGKVNRHASVVFANWLDSGRTIPTVSGIPLTPALSHKGRGGEIHSAMLAHRCGPVPMNRDKSFLETVR